jgi:hypothetical protein
VSATNRGGERYAEDYYPTPAWCVHALLNAGAIPEVLLPGGRWLEPCAGNGAVIAAVNNWRFFRQTDLPCDPRWTAVELRHEPEVVLGGFTKEVFITDYLKWKPPHAFQVAITNPPFKLAVPFIAKARTEAPLVAMLLRLAFAETQERQQFHRENPSDIYVLSKRPGFGKGGTDNAAYAWFVWGGPLGGGHWRVI